MFKSKYLLTASVLLLSLTAVAQFRDRNGNGIPDRREGGLRHRPPMQREWIDVNTGLDIQGLVGSAMTLNNLAQQGKVIHRSQVDLANAKLSQARQLISEVQMSIGDLPVQRVAPGACAQVYLGQNFTGPNYEVLRTDTNEFAANSRYYNFKWFPINVRDGGFGQRVDINDQVLSVAVAPGCEITLFQHAGFRSENVQAHTYRADAGILFPGGDRLYSSATCSCR